MPKRKPKKVSSPAKRKRKFPSVITLSKKQVAARLAKQAEQSKQERLLKNARAALRHFKVRKGDRGRIVFIGVKGQRNPQSKGRKGYAIDVTKTGKKRLILDKDKRIKPEKISNVKIPFQKRFKNKIRSFQSARLVKVKRGKVNRPVIRGQGNLDTGNSAYDFNERVVSKIARSVSKALSSVKSHRIFLVSVNILVELADGETRVFSFAVPIERPDHIAIKLGGIVNWLRKKFYAAMANELRYEGYVSSGSANHIRHLNENYGVRKTNWTQGDEPWRGQDLEVVKILTIEWKIEQSK